MPTLMVSVMRRGRRSAGFRVCDWDGCRFAKYWIKAVFTLWHDTKPWVCRYFNKGTEFEALSFTPPCSKWCNKLEYRCRNRTLQMCERFSALTNEMWQWEDVLASKSAATQRRKPCVASAFSTLNPHVDLIVKSVKNISKFPWLTGSTSVQEGVVRQHWPEVRWARAHHLVFCKQTQLYWKGETRTVRETSSWTMHSNSYNYIRSRHT
jgi:hypothetical protein